MEEEELTTTENNEEQTGADADNAGSENTAADTDEIYGSPDNYDYSQIQLPENITLDDELTKEFEPIAKKLNLSNKSANELMGLAIKLSQKNLSKTADAVKAVQEAKKQEYAELLNTDKELNTGDSTKYNQYLDVATQGLKAAATPEFIEFIKKEGLTHHPEFIKTFHKIGELCTSEKMPDVKYPAGQKEIDAADVLYKNS